MEIAIVPKEKIDLIEVKLDMIARKIQSATLDSWMDKDSFLQKFPSVSDRTFHDWRVKGIIQTKKIGKVIFVNTEKLFTNG